MDVQIISVVGGAIAAIAGQVGLAITARKMGLGDAQQTLITTLKDTNLAYQRRIETLESELKDARRELGEERIERARLGDRVRALEQLLANDALGAPSSPRARARARRMEASS